MHNNIMDLRDITADHIKLVIAGIVTAIGFEMVASRRSINHIIIGFLICAVASPFVYWYIAKLRHAKPADPEIDMLAKLGEKHIQELEAQQKANASHKQDKP